VSGARYEVEQKRGMGIIDHASIRESNGVGMILI